MRLRVDVDTIGDIAPFSSIQTARNENAGVLGLLLRQFPGRRHPLKHALVVAFLFESFDEFLDTYNQAERNAHEVGIENLHRLLARARHVELQRLVEADHQTITAAAKVLGVAVGVAAKWARTDGIEYKRRSRVLTEKSEQRLRAMAAGGKTYAEIGAELGIKKSFVRNYVAMNQDIRELWRQRRAEVDRGQRRSQFLELLRNNPGVPLKALRKVPGNGVSWLVRNDRAWLTEHLPKVAMGSSG